MERIAVEPRPDWRKKVEELGFVFHSVGTAYWEENACYRFTAQQIDTLETATNTLHDLCLKAAHRIISENLFDRLKIPPAFWPLIKTSWERDDMSIYGRFDLWYDGVNPPKLYEYNADTPTTLLEASVIQWHWLQDKFRDMDQFNSIHERLIARWKETEAESAVHFACVRDSQEDFANTIYMEDTAMQAGLKTKHLFIDEVGWDKARELFVDLEDEPIEILFKLYPWEWMIDEEFGVYLKEEPCWIMEPEWKMVLSNKGILPILWEMFPDHPNLLPAFFSPEPLGICYVEKPIFGREGANITLRYGDQEVSTPGEYGEEGFIYQALKVLPTFDGHYPVIGSWIIGDEAAGIGIREAETPITQNTSRFVPHFFPH
jgi:glutathionylspermidine synthase